MITMNSGTKAGCFKFSKDWTTPLNPNKDWMLRVSWCQQLVFLLLSLIGVVHAAQISIVRGAKGDIDVINIRGEIKLGDDDRFRSVAMSSLRATVSLDSPGGRLRPALEIGKMVRLKGFATAVQDATCTSACSLIWLAGEPRYMNNFTSIGFHTSFTTDKAGVNTSHPIDGAVIGAYLTSLGFSEKVVLFVVSASPKEMHWLQKSTADRLGISVNVQSSLRPITSISDFEEGLRARARSPSDDSRAASYYRKSAVAGYAGAQNNLGDLYESGRGVPKNDKLAVYWYTRAAERGEPTAFLSLASFLAQGSDDPEVLVEAAKYATLAFTYLPDGRNKDSAGGLTESLGKKLSQSDKQRVLDLVKQWSPLYQEEHLMGDSPGPR